MTLLALLFFLATVLATCHGSDNGLNFQIFPLRMKTSLGGHYIPEIYCSSWRLGEEAHNIINWTVPQECEGYVENYIHGKQYTEDSRVVTHEAYLYAKNLKLNGDGKDIWVFDIDETSLSNFLPSNAEHGFGVEPINAMALPEGMNLGIAPALPESLKLYNKLLHLGIKIVFLTGRSESKRKTTVKNLKDAGYYTWERLIMRDCKYENSTALIYKSAKRKKLEEKGYRIVGNIGDQWSDILGTNTGNRTFKLPNPMYYIS